MAVLSYKERPEAFGMPALKPNYAKNARKRPVLRPSGKATLPEFYDSTLIKPLEPIAGLNLNPASLAGQAEPEFIKARFEDIRIDQNSQRELRQSNLSLIEFAVNNFDYTRVKVPNGFMAPSGKIYLVDGQSTALIYYHHPETRKRGYVPCFVSRVSERDFVARCAQAFVALNECHVPVPQVDRFTAAITAGSPKALAMANIFKKHNVRITADKKPESKCGAGETRLIRTFESIYDKRGEEFFKKLCRIAGRVAFSPIKRIHVAALVQILDNDKNDKLDEERLINAIRSIVDRHAQNEAELTAKRRMWTAPYALAELYRDRYKRRAAAL